MADKSRGFYIYTDDKAKVKNLKINLLPIRTAENDVRAYKSLRIRMGTTGNGISTPIPSTTATGNYLKWTGRQ